MGCELSRSTRHLRTLQACATRVLLRVLQQPFGKHWQFSECDILDKRRVSAIGLDIDGTITQDPAFFSALTRDCRRHGISTHVVSSRSREGRTDTIIELREYQITYDELYLLPSISEAQTLCPYGELDWFSRHGWLKSDYALQNGLSHFVDDDERILALFRKYTPGIEVISVIERYRLRALIPNVSASHG